MRTLVYRRTHPHDPDESGCFGVEDCMGSVRDWKFDAVIGVGGNGYEARGHNINCKVNWIGIGPHKHKSPRRCRGSLVTFDHFVLFEAGGPDFCKLAPNLAKRVYSTKGRCPFIKFNPTEQDEIFFILKLAKSEPPSSWRPDDKPEKKKKCRPTCGSVCSRRRGKVRKVPVKC